MASIRKIKNTFHVSIRKKGNFISKSFSNIETAELWAKYKEDLIDEIEAFNVPSNQLISVGKSIQLKINDMISNNYNIKTISDLKTLYKLCDDFKDEPVSNLTYDFLVSLLNKWMKENVFRGGCVFSNKDKIGNKPKIGTIRNRFTYLSGVITFLNEKGIAMDNHAIKILAYIRTLKKNEV